MYSLVSASLLALDLARHPTGAAVADVTDRVLALQPDELALLATACQRRAPERDAARERVRAACAATPRMSTVMRGVARTVEVGLPGPAAARTIAQVLAETLLGGLEDLLALLQRELPLADPQAPGDAVQAALDAVTAAWAGRGAGVALEDLALLRAPWAKALQALPPAVLPDDGYGLGRPALAQLLEQLARLDGDAWLRVDAAHAAVALGLSWSDAMHEASRAAHEAGRLVPVARAQLAAARAVRLAGVSTTASASAAMMAVTAAVQATCLLDVLDAGTATTLLAPLGEGIPPGLG